MLQGPGHFQVQPKLPTDHGLLTQRFLFQFQMLLSLPGQDHLSICISNLSLGYHLHHLDRIKNCRFQPESVMKSLFFNAKKHYLV